MGKLVELLKDVSLPPEVESEVRLLDLQFDQMEARLKETDETATLSLDELKPEQEPRYTTQRMIHPDEPTEAEAALLKQLQPPGRRVNIPSLAQDLKMNLTVTQHHLNELQRKGHVSPPRHRQSGFRHPAGPPTYSLTEKGTKYLVDHGLTD